MDEDLQALEGRVAARLREARSVCVALSGGVDSSLTLALAVRALGAADVTAFTAASATTAPGELAAARALAAHTSLDARAIAEAAMGVAAGICIYTNGNISIEEL